MGSATAFAYGGINVRIAIKTKGLVVIPNDQEFLPANGAVLRPVKIVGSIGVFLAPLRPALVHPAFKTMVGYPIQVLPVIHVVLDSSQTLWRQVIIQFFVQHFADEK